MSDPDSTTSPAGKTRPTLTSPLKITSDKPESAPSFPILAVTSSACGSLAGTILIGTVLVVIWNRRRTRNPPVGLNPGVVVGSNTNTAASVVASAIVLASGDNRQYVYEDVDCPRVKTGQGNIQCLNIGNLSHNQVLAALKPNHMYAGNTAVSVMASGDYHQYENVDCPRVKTGQGQYQAITEPNTNTTATVMTSGDDQTGQGQSQTNTESTTHTTATLDHIPAANQQGETTPT
ncbi:PREDICTED: uncharacterized protein LOC109473161 [Branchiostoma belcheri]|uniref:Uncharacterized protein LOC109473161 n=1 Tax=Branchiostoma belcheri TaxID=7741 RepID=A0A6P4ZG08_BRABE|nr:PREDICTED: uncharacterized protein LOC109473161 [Branchiostoma belcheri]